MPRTQEMETTDLQPEDVNFNVTLPDGPEAMEQADQDQPETKPAKGPRILPKQKGAYIAIGVALAELPPAQRMDLCAMLIRQGASRNDAIGECLTRFALALNNLAYSIPG